MTIVDKLIWDYHKSDEKNKESISKELLKNHFNIMDLEDRYLLICTNKINQKVGRPADKSILKTVLEERFKNIK